jgi:hypothetical protein
MPSKSKLKRRLKKQAIKHQLEISDATIEIDKLDYELTFAEIKIETLLKINKELTSKLEKSNTLATVIEATDDANVIEMRKEYDARTLK